jgi:pyruvate,water dikinase
MKGKELYILQSRPITVNDNEEKQWYLSLKRSFDDLEKLANRVENEVLPQMEEEANKNAKIELSSLTDNELIKEIENRKNIYDKWNEVYWNECIPFAHGVRLFATVYNDKIKPDDAFEFIELILPQKMKSTNRNSLIEDTSKYLKENPDSIDNKGNIKDILLKDMIDNIAREIGLTLTEANEQEAKDLLKIIKETSKTKVSKKINEGTVNKKIQYFLDMFPKEQKDYAKKLLWLARKSYQLRDDDNIYLGKLSSNISLALKEANYRISYKLNDENLCYNAEEAIKALRFPDYIPPISPKKKTISNKTKLNMRQLRGQPASKGIARGKAHLIISEDDLYNVKKDHIIVCDAIDPTMTFVIPIAKAIVERRGGMLIHGAIIAREYNIPCVTGIPQATKFIKNGDDITVDGYYGLVINHSRTLI